VLDAELGEALLAPVALTDLDVQVECVCPSVAGVPE
jgi:hypothetical protein